MNAVLLKLGFVVLRQKGSHVFYKHPDGRTTTVPNHGSKDLNIRVTHNILRDIDLTPDQFRKVLDEL